MTAEELLAEVVTLLQHEGRLSYRLLKRRFALDDEYLEDLKVELIQAKKLASDEAGAVLVWVGATPVSSIEYRVPSSTQPPAPNPQSPTPNPQSLVWFTEGFDTKDLQEAKALIEELRH